ncbi:MAG: NADH-quinone oxidoreductase subunit J [Acidobacteriota bacterium]|jgi:NADH-quinone oxidoreductase subunit J|nr:NADH-quinone oxidoreductase subunit J [Acidobacteriota bacterium]
MTISPNDFFIFISLALMTLSALWAVMATDILKSALGLALTSVFLSIVIFLLGSPLAAVFELSVCAGLITVVFISAISMIKPEGHTRGEDLGLRRKRRLKKYLPLPLLLVIAGILLWVNRTGLPVSPPPPDGSPLTMLEVMWDERRIDLAGQAIMILVGVFGIVVLFKEYMNRKGSAD